VALNGTGEVEVNDMLYVALECLCITVNWKGDLVGLLGIFSSPAQKFPS
jgi:hypothetical protein